MHMNPLGVIGTENHVGQRINGLPGYAEYSLSDSNRGKNHSEDPSGSGNIDILSLTLSLSFLISLFLFLSLSFLPFL